MQQRRSAVSDDAGRLLCPWKEPAYVRQAEAYVVGGVVSTN